MHQNLLTVAVHVFIIDQWKEAARLYEIQIRVNYSGAILVAVTSGCYVKEGYL